MNETNQLVLLQKENERLKSDNEMLLNIVAQMKVTLNRLLSRYISDNNSERMV
ncbi:hypothetical protein GPL15_11835 [Clostridium sp. MCC353]|uniref:hypothetical protein n=1 Tax=Clostridium sp. MCC353 TaxID=2592646 RepID=UPI001C032371|nr:hypothetical protein [Clostridium sp. MCC353]MBT9777193.1 hypothetical protein [Clostridium sp. MCC353]